MRDNMEDAMSLLELFQEFSVLGQTGLIGIAIILCGMIKIPKKEINLWNLIGRTIGRSINKESMQQVTDFSNSVTTQITNLSNDFNQQITDLNSRIDNLETALELERVRSARQRILRFNDEILFDRKHSKEHFDEILDDITLYEHYCASHKDYENNKAVLAISTIKQVYDECMITHDFLAPQKKEKKAS